MPGVEDVSTAELLGPLNVDRAEVRHPRVAIVGPRHPSSEGERRVKRLVRELVKVNTVIVSGLAQGVDMIAHTETLALAARRARDFGSEVAEARPKARTHVESLTLAKPLSLPAKVTLIDDVVTRGAQLFSAAWAIWSVRPDVEVRASALVGR